MLNLAADHNVPEFPNDPKNVWRFESSLKKGSTYTSCSPLCQYWWGKEDEWTFRDLAANPDNTGYRSGGEVH